MPTRDLIVHDEFIKGSAKSCLRYGKELEEILTEYISILKSIHSTSLLSGQLSDALEEYIETASLLQGTMTSNSTKIEYDLRSYLTAIDIADDYLF